jgi:hypothetical protein
MTLRSILFVSSGSIDASLSSSFEVTITIIYSSVNISPVGISNSKLSFTLKANWSKFLIVLLLN